MPVDERLARSLHTHHDTLFQVSTINYGICPRCQSEQR
jgi:hypothetical protein